MFEKQRNKRLQQSWLSSRFLLTQEHAPMPRYRSAAKQLNRTLSSLSQSYADIKYPLFVDNLTTN